MVSSTARGRYSISIHALREEGDRRRIAEHGHCGEISIHALREEGDAVARRNRRFCTISIHALREEGDERGADAPFGFFEISIHALREEGDLSVAYQKAIAGNFYPRPPRGGRPTPS